MDTEAKKRDELKDILRKLHEAKPEELDKIKKEAKRGKYGEVFK